MGEQFDDALATSDWWTNKEGGGRLMAFCVPIVYLLIIVLAFIYHHCYKKKRGGKTQRGSKLKGSGGRVSTPPPQDRTSNPQIIDRRWPLLPDHQEIRTYPLKIHKLNTEETMT